MTVKASPPAVPQSSQDMGTTVPSVKICHSEGCSVRHKAVGATCSQAATCWGGPIQYLCERVSELKCDHVPVKRSGLVHCFSGKDRGLRPQRRRLNRGWVTWDVHKAADLLHGSLQTFSKQVSTLGSNRPTGHSSQGQLFMA